MTREAFRVVDDHDGDAEVFSALWAAARSLPQLPPDAPQELRNLTVEVRDPKRIYAIYRASRRYNFQLFVERYITQLRYGCQDVYCNISTCLTYRIRAAGSKPLRRYNATSARTLACFLASQDNPELGLCQSLKIGPSKNDSYARMGSHPKRRASMEIKSSHGSHSAVLKPSNQHHGRSGAGYSLAFNQNLSSTSSNRSKSKVKMAMSEMASGTSGTAKVQPTVSSLDEPVKTDHRSFVQNMFGTVAFRMIEWLTPRNLEALITSNTSGEEPALVEREHRNVESKVPNLDTTPILTEHDSHDHHAASPISNHARQISTESFPSEKPDLLTTLDGQNEVHSDETLRRSSSKSAGHHRHSNDSGRGNYHDLPVPAMKNMNGSATTDFTDQDFVENVLSLGGLNGQSLVNEDKDKFKKIAVESQPVSSRTIRRQAATGTSPTYFTEQNETLPYHDFGQSSILHGPKYVIPTPAVASDKSPETKSIDVPPPAIRVHGQRKVIGSTATGTGTSKLPTETLPQSLKYLSLEIIDLLCEILQRDAAFDLRSAYVKTQFQNEGPRKIRDSASKQDARTQSTALLPIPIVGLAHSSQTWRLFAEQSLFYVISSPASLLYSFSENGQCFDTQTLWYCMLRLIRHFPSLIFESLWISAEALFSPPEEVWQFLETPYNVDSSSWRVTPEKAASLMSLCLHALVAAVPYVHDGTDLFTISRIRSYGLSSSHGRRISKDLAQLCLLYDDVFSDEMALRLARRVFAAIPVRRKYQNILTLNSTQDPGASRSDILDLVLAPLNFLDIEVPPILDFSMEERQLHEKRAPTLLIDWARTIMLQDWSGHAEVPADGSFGGALAMIQAIYIKRKSLLLGDVHFRTEYFAERLDSMQMPVEWLSFDRHLNKRTVHLLDYPYLFSPSTLVTYFRAINFSRMNRAYEASGSTMGRVQATISASLMTDASRREDLYKRLRTATSKYLVLQIRRTDVLVDAFNYLWRREERELSRPLKIRLGEDTGEEGSDSGGVQQEFFRLAIAEALNPDYGAFTVDDRTRMTWFRPSSPEPLWKFELIGLIVSLAIYNGLTLPVTFPKALYRKLLGLPVTDLHHIEDGWPDLASGLGSLLEWDEADGSVEDVFSRTYEFTIDSFGHQISRDMAAESKWPQFGDSRNDNPVGVRMVTGGNRDEYVSDYIQWLTDVSISPQFSAFKRGFITCLDQRALRLFDNDILQSVVEGVQDIDISELRRYTRYVGWPGDASHRTIKDFWSIVKKYGLDEKKKLLEFVTASDRVPVGGMRNLQFVIQRNGVGDVDGHLPTSYTCYGTLLLPEYSSKDVLRDKLGMALENAKGFGFA